MTSPFTSNVNGPARQVSGLMAWIVHLFPLQKMHVPSLRARIAWYPLHSKESSGTPCATSRS